MSSLTEPILTTSTNTDAVIEKKILSKQATQHEKLLEKIDSLETALSTLKKAADMACLEIKTLKKQAHKLKLQKQKKQVKTDRKPHGFAVPTKVSDLICEFMGLPTGSFVARTAVTQRLTEYVKEKNLQNKENPREIIPDTFLMKILGDAARNQYLTHFTIQKYINHHFIKSSPSSDNIEKTESV
jgi:chromatin remodeling complex protein RSC6